MCFGGKFPEAVSVQGHGQEPRSESFGTAIKLIGDETFTELKTAKTVIVYVMSTELSAELRGHERLRRSEAKRPRGVSDKRPTFNAEKNVPSLLLSEFKKERL